MHYSDLLQACSGRNEIIARRDCWEKATRLIYMAGVPIESLYASLRGHTVATRLAARPAFLIEVRGQRFPWQPHDRDLTAEDWSIVHANP